MRPYQEMMSRLASGWNTWNTFSIFSHAHLPAGFAINLLFKDGGTEGLLRQGYIGHYPQSQGPNTDLSLPGPRSYDGRYTEIDLTWRGNHFLVQSATSSDDDQVLLITPIDPDGRPNTVAVECALLWNRPGSVQRVDQHIEAETPHGVYRVFATATTDDDPYFQCTSPYLVCPVSEALGVSSGTARSLDEIRAIVEQRKQEVLAERARFGEGELRELYEGLHAAMAWNTIYDAKKDRVVSPVSRVWNAGWNGYVLFCWDTYFAGLMAGIDNKELAYANVVEITREMTARGFIPNFASGGRRGSSEDRSQPPVGARVLLDLYRRWGDAWIVEEIFDELLHWNRWWAEKRVTDRWLGWGSNAFQSHSVHDQRQGGTLKGAVLESGLDNSPMYDEASFDPETEVMRMADAGLNGMYVMDCRALAELAEAIGRADDQRELLERAERFSSACAELWDEDAGIFLNRHTDSGTADPVLSPTNFYPLCGRIASQAQAERMLAEHLFNEEEFWGEWVLPASARNARGFEDQQYWRGRVWGPMNQIVYWGLQEYDLPEARRKFAEGSARTFLKEWREHKHVHENYNSITGEGCDAQSSNRFYHWGALLALIPLIEEGYYRADA